VAGLFVIDRVGVYRQQALGARVVNTTGVVNMVRLQVGNSSLGAANVVALDRASLGLGLLYCF
jgi:hypothetical protein